MEPLSGVDASFLYAETPANPLQTLKALVLELPPDCADRPFERILGGLRERLHLLPTLRTRALSAPLSIGHPVWFEDADVDLAEHVEREVLDEGAGLDGLAEVMSRVAGMHLPRDRPLWRLHVVEGLGERRVALLFRIHHALTDGAGFAHLLARVATEAPAEAPPPGPRPRRELAPTPARLLARALRERAAQLIAIPPLLARTAVGVSRRVRRELELDVDDRHVFGGATTSFDRPLTARRALALASIPFADVHRVKEAAGCSLNDAVLAVCAGALRAYLVSRGEPTGRPLVCSVPVGLDDAHLRGNRVSNLVVTLHVERPDPLERLAATIESASAAKELHALLGPRMLEDWARLSRRRPVQWLWRRLVPASARAPVNLIASNVRGPAREVFLGRARVVDLYSVGPLLETTGLNLTFWSYAGRLNACVLGCPDHGTDPRALGVLLSEATAELLEALGA